MSEASCYHCGDLCDNESVVFDEKKFCCNGCKMVYSIFSENGLDYFYELEKNPGIKPSDSINRFEYLKSDEIVQKLLDFEDETIQVVTFYIPKIHCSSCIWILENLNRLNPNIVKTRVNFSSKKVTFHYRHKEFSLFDLVNLLNQIAYTPVIRLDDENKPKIIVHRKSIYQLAIAGFAFGNIMLLSFPEYFQVSELWLDHFKPFFRWLMLILSLPVVFYSSQNFFVVAFQSLKRGILNIDVPIALGIAALFLQSIFDVFFNRGSGYFDSLSGLVFLMLLGRLFQQKTYDFLSFERDYKSYFPLAVTRINSDKMEEIISINLIKKGDRILIKNGDIIPADCILTSEQAQIDYSFVSGESRPVEKYMGDKIYAGGRQVAGAIELKTLTTVSQSRLTRLWEQHAFKNDKTSVFENLTDTISQYFTPVILLIAALSGIYWWIYNPEIAIRVVTAVLIVACPCALALATPFTLGNIMRIFGKKNFYLKNTQVIERLAKTELLIFDKTGTLTESRKMEIEYVGETLSNEEINFLKSALRQSNHPLSRQLQTLFQKNEIIPIEHFEETPGFGFKATSDLGTIKVGRHGFAGSEFDVDDHRITTVHISTNDIYKGYFTFKHQFRQGVKKLLENLVVHSKLMVLSGDKLSAQKDLETVLPGDIYVLLEQTPEDKLLLIEKLQKTGTQITMLGDGLNDAGALAQSNVGISISEDTATFSPACDAILLADKLLDFDKFLKASKKSVRIIKICFVVSFAYNSIGLTFAVTGLLSPLVAAVLMPLSSISVVVLSTVLTNRVGKNL